MLTTHTAVLASGQGIVGMSQEIFAIVVAVGGLAALGLGIVVGKKMGYKEGIGAAIGAVVGGIILALVIGNIAGFRDFERFVTVDSGLGTLHAYSAATVSSLRSQQPVPEAPDEGQQLRVWATVTARAADYSTTALDYPLTLRATGGSWSVAAIDAVPAMDAQEDPAPMTNTR